MPPSKPAKPAKPSARTAQSERLAAALRDNLKRRKAQARARRAPETAAGKAEPRRP